MRDRSLLVSALMLSCLSLVPVVGHAVGLQWVDSPSVPEGVYQTHALGQRPLARGDYVCLEAWRPQAPEAIRTAVSRGQAPTAWVNGKRLTKRIAGLPGDSVAYVGDEEGGHVEINGVPLPTSTALAYDSAGARLPRPALPRVLGPHEYWLTSEDPRGFDSRYFGPVHAGALACRAELVWRW